MIERKEKNSNNNYHLALLIMKIGTTKQTEQATINDTDRETVTITLDYVIQQCGDLNRFQLLHYFFLNLLTASAGIVAYYYVYGAAEPDHRCRLPYNIWPNDQYKTINYTHEQLIGSWVSNDDKCLIYANLNLTDKIDCGTSNGWVYDRSTYGFTFTEEADMVCKSRTKRSTLATMMQSGGLFLLIIGSLGDKYGRKITASMITVIIFVICLITQIAMQWIPMSINIK
ncbi:unnamed protein product [Didymodactylos carnosus]|uniref:Uncharacterized protein n=1 Tax=Didymodactylos carnosus TaxID=1234261 RepID=A0A815AL57_9BILA|nr:unnamed protein product [Didymodactylos carnosus]CAF4033808.1 unnamed protein product [Didymodactylos carnosus]